MAASRDVAEANAKAPTELYVAAVTAVAPLSGVPQLSLAAIGALASL